MAFPLESLKKEAFALSWQEQKEGDFLAMKERLEKPQPVLAIVGPTAVGKTALALAYAELLESEIISADSVQIFKELDIGSAKPSHEELSRVPHHGISILSPAEQPNVGLWVKMAKKEIARLHAEGKIPIVSGGTGLYVRSLFEGLAEIPALSKEREAALEHELETFGVEALHGRLKSIDPSSYERISPQDAQRVKRALAVYLETGKSISAWQQSSTKPPPYHTWTLLLELDKESLDARIRMRAELMMESGLLDEVKDLLQHYPSESPALKTLGYRALSEAIQSKSDLESLGDKLYLAHRKYAKRQRTWFKKAKIDQVLVKNEALS